MIIAVASGKGGTGKTTISVALAQVSEGPVRFLDADVEGPNSHLFLRPKIEKTFKVYLPVPEIDESRCTYCGQCREICRFSAITVIGQTILSFPEMCHGCLGCVLVCPEMALREGKRELGLVETGLSGEMSFVQGRLRVGEAMASPLIRAIKEMIDPQALNIVDCPPGTACAAISALKGADFCLLVAEDTPFGHHDLKAALETVALMGIPAGVIINRAGLGDLSVRQYLQAREIPILLEIPHDREIASACAQGIPLLKIRPDLTRPLKMVLEAILRRSR